MSPSDIHQLLGAIGDVKGAVLALQARQEDHEKNNAMFWDRDWTVLCSTVAGHTTDIQSLKITAALHVDHPERLAVLESFRIRIIVYMTVGSVIGGVAGGVVAAVTARLLFAWMAGS